MASKQLFHSTVETLGEAGDLTAEPGSREWAIAVRLEMISGIRDTKSDAASVLSWRRLFEKHEGYSVLPDQYGQPFKSYRAFCEASPPWGLGYDPDVLAQVLEERKSAQARAATASDIVAHGGDRKSEAHQGSVSTLNGKRDADYLASRIKRDHPEIHDRLLAGEYSSVRAAAIEAGIVRRTITIPLDVDIAAQALRRHFTPDDLATLRQLLTDED
jgi:hypothetical protein